MKRTGLLAAAALLASGCMVEVTQVRDPAPLFREARAEAARVAGRPGPAHELNVLAYDPSDSKLVRVILPMWLVRQAYHHGDWDFDVDDKGAERLHRCLKRHLRLRDLERAGLGTLIEVLRPGRFDRIIEIQMPNFEARSDIYKIHTKRMNLDPNVNVEEVAAKSEGSTGADIKAICTAAGMFAIRENRDIVTMPDFEKAITKVLDEGTEKALESGPMFA